jgi:hypothetical protein
MDQSAREKIGMYDRSPSPKDRSGCSNAYSSIAIEGAKSLPKP